MRALKWTAQAVIAGLTFYLAVLLSMFGICWGLPRLKARADNALETGA